MKRLFLEILKFGLVGFGAFLIDYGLMVFLTECLSVNYLISSAISFTVSVIFNYTFSVFWVFEVKDNKNGVKAFIIFILLSGIGLLLNQLLMYAGTDVFKIYYMVTKVFATGIVMVYNFVTRKMFFENSKE